MNFQKIKILEQAEFVGPKNVSIRPINNEKKKTVTHIAPGESDEVAMARFAGESTVCFERVGVLL